MDEEKVLEFESWVLSLNFDELTNFYHRVKKLKKTYTDDKN